jgi:hypothetical protein
MERKSFILEAKHKEIIDEMDNETAGILLKAIFHYVVCGEVPVISDIEAKIAFKFIKQDLDWKQDKWEETCERRSEAGKKGMKTRWGNNKSNKPITNDNKNNKCYKPITNITDTDTDTDIDINDNDVNYICSESAKTTTTSPPSEQEVADTAIPDDIFDDDVGDKSVQTLQTTKAGSSPPEPAETPPALAGLELYEQDAKLTRQWNKLIKAWIEAYPAVNICAEVRAAHAWEVANPKKRKLNRARFLNNWLARRQDRGSPVPTSSTNSKRVDVVNSTLKVYEQYRREAEEAQNASTNATDGFD